MLRCGTFLEFDKNYFRSFFEYSTIFYYCFRIFYDFHYYFTIMSFNRRLEKLLDDLGGDAEAIFDALNLPIPDDSEDESCDGKFYARFHF